MTLYETEQQEDRGAFPWPVVGTLAFIIIAVLALAYCTPQGNKAPVNMSANPTRATSEVKQPTTNEQLAVCLKSNQPSAQCVTLMKTFGYELCRTPQADGSVKQCWCRIIPAPKKIEKKVTPPAPAPAPRVTHTVRREPRVTRIMTRVVTPPAPVTPAVMELPPVPVLPPVLTATPVPPAPAMRAVPVYERREVETVEQSAADLELEAIAGVWGWRSNSAAGHGAYGEFAVKFDIGDGQKLGVGALGMVGSGHSLTGDYRWRERRYGPQVTWGRSYMRTVRRADGSVDELPAYTGVKARLLFDHVEGENPTSGYQMSQDSLCGNIYAEHLERTSANHMWGVTGEGLFCGRGRIRSTWAGDQPQNRGMIQVTGFGQDRLNNDLQVRYGLKGTHQFWDGANYLSPFAELRFKETVMCGGQYNIGLSHLAGNSVLGFCRVELGGQIRAWDKKRRVSRVELVQTGVRYEPVETMMPQDTVPVAAPVVAGADLPEDTQSVTAANDNLVVNTPDVEVQAPANDNDNSMNTMNLAPGLVVGE